VRAVVQRVFAAAVTVEGETVGRIGPGLAVFLGVGRGDGESTARRLAEKVARLRIFPDAADKMNRSVQDSRGSVLVVSQFTLYGDCQGNRPGFGRAAPPGVADELYRCFGQTLRDMGIEVATGVFGARMRVDVANDGPVTIILDTER
jgi:D-tyrosyl-tRNA(Tyr) deacylase